MRLTHIFILILLITFTLSDKILNDYGNGNKGLGVNDTVKGANNTWVGNNNSINGNVNKVIGHQNRIKGSNNIVQGNNNVIGEASPQQIIRLQNQMFASFQDRFKGLFFNSLPQAKPEPLQQQKEQKQNYIPNKQKPIPPKQAQAANNTTNTTNTKNLTPETVQIKNSPSQAHQPPRQTKSQPKIQFFIQQSYEQPQLILLFRSYGSQYAQSVHQETFNLQPQIKLANSQLCKRWNYCYLDNRSMRWSFSSIYPQFPSLIEQ